MQLNGRNIPWLNLSQLVIDKSAQHGDKIFAIIDGRELSYRELESASLKVALNLLEMGVVKGDRVATLIFNCVEQVIMCFGAARMGGVWTPLNAGLGDADLDHTLRDSGARVLIADAESRPKVDRLDEALRVQISVFCIDDPTGSYPSFSELLRDPESGSELPEVGPGDPALILYTGGTTGLPKGVVTPGLSLILAGIRYAEAFTVKPGERHFTTGPLFHALAIHVALMGPLMSDMTTVIDRRFSLSRYWQRVRETRANVIDPVGSVVTMLCNQLADDIDREHNVRVSVGIVNQIPIEIPDIFKKRFGIPMIDVYGLTEGGGALLTTNRLDSYVPGSNGKPHGWIEIRIVDDNDFPLPPNEVGQILIRPLFPHLGMICYHNSQEKTLESMRDLWLHTGDIGRVDENGNLYFQGRKAHWLRRRGENISAYEIEAILGGHPSIAEVVVVGVLADVGEDDIKAFIILKPGPRPDEASIVQWCSGRIAPFKVPRYFEFVDDFPRSITKREIERSVLKKKSNANAWDREREMGRLSGQSSR